MPVTSSHAVTAHTAAYAAPASNMPTTCSFRRVVCFIVLSLTLEMVGTVGLAPTNPRSLNPDALLVRFNGTSPLFHLPDAVFPSGLRIVCIVRLPPRYVKRGFCLRLRVGAETFGPVLYHRQGAARLALFYDEWHFRPQPFPSAHMRPLYPKLPVSSVSTSKVWIPHTSHTTMV